MFAEDAVVFCAHCGDSLVETGENKKMTFFSCESCGSKYSVEINERSGKTVIRAVIMDSPEEERFMEDDDDDDE